MNPTKIFVFTVIGLLVFGFACTDDYFPVPPPPKKPQATQQLEAAYRQTGPLTLNDPYWKQADYFNVTLADLSKANLYSDGFLNMTGTYNGISSFNKGKTTNLTMKAAYDDSRLYILMEWDDTKADPSFGSWLLDGPQDALKSESNQGWTSQRNTDQVALAFDINGAKGASGTFTDVGCAASCHSGSSEKKVPEGSIDIWNWNLALSDPMGYAHDRIINSTGITYDAGQKTFVRNTASNGARSGPQYIWDGTPQTVTRAGKSTTLDPAFFILNKTEYKGDPVAGFTVYTNKCAHCHGDNGEGYGPDGEGPAFTTPGKFNRWSRQSLEDFATSTSHTGFTYYSPLSEKQKQDVIARLQAFAGVPGNILQQPDGSNADIMAVSNIPLLKVDDQAARTKYQVLLIRKLNTGNTDDANFDVNSGKQYTFGIALMDNDGKNHIGSNKQVLTFKTKN